MVLDRLPSGQAKASPQRVVLGPSREEESESRDVAAVADGLPTEARGQDQRERRLAVREGFETSVGL
jgi:hypothetical protein